jgi:hypothetical protein
MGKPPGDEKEVHTRPTGWDELAQHSDCHGSDSDPLKNAKRSRRSSQREDKSSHLAGYTKRLVGCLFLICAWIRILDFAGHVELP